MQKISSDDLFIDVVAKRFWLLYYSFPWAGSSPSVEAFAYWVHRKRKYIDDRLLPCPNFIALEGSSPRLDKWLVEQSERRCDNIFGDGAGTILICVDGEVVDFIPMLVETGLIDFSQRVASYLEEIR